MKPQGNDPGCCGPAAALAGVCTAGLVGATLLFCTPLFEHMPLNALGAIVIASVIGLVQYDECLFLWKVCALSPDSAAPACSH